MRHDCYSALLDSKINTKQKQKQTAALLCSAVLCCAVLNYGEREQKVHCTKQKQKQKQENAAAKGRFLLEMNFGFTEDPILFGFAEDPSFNRLQK